MREILTSEPASFLGSISHRLDDYVSKAKSWSGEKCGLRSIYGKALASVADLVQTSKNAIQAYLDEQRADGALVLHTPTWRVDGTTYQSIVMTDLTVYPYKLSKMSGDRE